MILMPNKSNAILQTFPILMLMLVSGLVAKEVQSKNAGECETAVVWMIEHVKESVEIAFYVPTSINIAAALAKAQSQGVEIRIVLNGNNSEANNLLRGQGIRTKVIEETETSKRQFAIFDSRTLVSGDFSWGPRDNNSQAPTSCNFSENKIHAESYKRIFNENFWEPPIREKTFPREENQKRSLGIGYLGGFPTTPIGLQGYSTVYHGFGYYVDFQGNFKSITPNYDSISRNTAENSFRDPFVKDQTVWLVFDMGATYGLFSWLTLYAGVGYAQGDYWRQYNDRSGILSPNSGNYWVRDSAGNDGGLNILGGAIIAIRPGGRGVGFTLSIGYERKPAGLLAGLGIIF